MFKFSWIERINTWQNVCHIVIAACWLTCDYGYKRAGQNIIVPFLLFLHLDQTAHLKPSDLGHVGISTGASDDHRCFTRQKKKRSGGSLVGLVLVRYIS